MLEGEVDTRCSADARMSVGGFSLCEHSWSQPLLGPSCCCHVPALEPGDLLRASRLMGMAAAPSTGNREVTPGRGMRPQPGKTKCRTQTRPCTHPPTCLSMGCSEQSPDRKGLPKVKNFQCLQLHSGEGAHWGRGTPKIVTVLRG